VAQDPEVSRSFAAIRSKTMFGSSQTLSSGAEAMVTTPAKRVEEKTTCVPVNARMLLDAVAARADEGSEVLIHGSEVGVIVLVGVVEALVQQSAMLEFQLNDASGRIKVRHYGSGLTDTLTPGRYVAIVGNLRTSPAVHVSAMSLRAVSQADEVSYHMIDVAHTALRLRNPALANGSNVAAAGLPLAGSITATDPITPAKLSKETGIISPMKAEAPVSSTHMAPAAIQTPPPKADLRSSVLQVLRQEQDKVGDEGLALSALLVQLQAPSDKVKEIVSALVDEGEVFTTIDDEHFLLL